jgi:hypothetical protein
MSPEKARNILRRLEFVHTSKHGSWRNIAEIELSLLKRLGIAKRVETKAELEKQIESYQNKRNTKQAKVDWQFTTKDARVKLKRLYPSIES